MQLRESHIGEPLPWPPEPAAPPGPRLALPASNLVLDLHGCPLAPELVLFMAGNQFRALPPLLSAFQAASGIERVFYATTPPGVLIDALAAGRLACGNLQLTLSPHGLWPDVFMAGARERMRLAALGQAGETVAYARNRGSVLLVRHGNPLGVRGVPDLLRPEVRVAISSPEREAASHASYAATLDAQGGAGFTRALLAKPGTWHPQAIHHREVPQRLADGLADVAPLFAHLADYVARAFPGVFELVPLAAQGNARDELAATQITAAPHPLAAAAWCRFLRSDPAASILTQHGFEPTP